MSLTTAEDPALQAADSADDELPGGVEPLWKQPALERYYGVSNWMVNHWIQRGMPVEPVAMRGRRFDMAKVRKWMAENAVAASA